MLSRHHRHGNGLAPISVIGSYLVSLERAMDWSLSDDRLPLKRTQVNSDIGF